MTYTNPSLPQSKGLEAESGEELYFVDNALSLQNRKHGIRYWLVALIRRKSTYRSATVDKS
jgi:hypothetical protein